MGNLKTYPFWDFKKPSPLEYIKTQQEFFIMKFEHFYTLYKNIGMTFFSKENLLPIWLDYKPGLV